MNIVSITLAGPGTEDIIGDAIRSVPWVDARLIVNTYGGNDAFAAAVTAAEGRQVQGSYRHWEDDFSLMRNAALHHAEIMTPGDWALWLDTDERIICPDPEKLRATLADFPQVDAVSAPHISGAYHKDRLLRLPQRGSYIGPTHEYWRPHEEKPVLRVGPDLLAFDELPRDPDATLRKMERDERLLSWYIDTGHGDEARWPYYLGQTYHNMGDPERAIAQWEIALDTDGDPLWREVRGWSAFRAAEALLPTDPERGMSIALRGLAVYPASPELLWVIAASCLNLGKPREAQHWAHYCLAAGHHGGGPRWERSGNQWPDAWHEAPFEISALALEAMGDEAGSAKAREWHERVKAARNMTR